MRVVRHAITMPREQVHVFLGHPGIRRDDPDFYKLSVMDHVLGTGPGFTDRISRKLRDEQGLCYTVSASITSSAGLEPGHFSAYIGTSPQNVARAIEGDVELNHARPSRGCGARAPRSPPARRARAARTGSRA